MNTRKAHMLFAPWIGVMLAVGCGGNDAATSSPDLGASGSEHPAFFGAADATNVPPELGLLNVQIGDSADTLGAELLAPTLAVTSLRSVARTSYTGGSGVGGSSSGTVCSTVGAPYDASQFTFTLGNTASAPTRKVTQIILNGQATTCDGNMAFFVLDSPIEGVTFPKIQLDQIPSVNDSIRGCSYGAVDSICTLPSSAVCADGVLIIPNGGNYAADEDKFPVGTAVANVAGCTSQDRGSGLYDPSNNLLGVFDRPFQADKTKVATLAEPCGECQGAVSDAQLFSSQAAYVARAFAAVGSSPWRVGHTKPADIGGTCADALDCNSQFCIAIGDSHYCSQDCTTAACPSGNICSAVGDRNVCLPAVTPHPASCSASPSPSESSRSTVPWVALLLGLVLRAARKKQRVLREDNQ